MRKALSIVVMLLVAFIGVAAAKSIVLKVKVQTANVRSEPDTSASVVAQLKVGTLIEAKSKVDSWYEVSVPGKSGEEIVGYIHASVVDVVGGQPAPAPEPAARPAQPEPARDVYRPAPASARPAAPSGVKPFKILAGLALANQRLDSDSQKAIDDADASKGALLGIGAGVGYEFSLSPNLFVEADGFFLPVGMKVTGTIGEDDYKTLLHGYALDLSLLGKFKLTPEGSTPYGLLGVDFGYILSLKYRTDVGSKKGEEEDLFKEDDYKRTYFGLGLGLGYELQMSGLTLVAEARYRLGLSSILRQPKGVEDKDWTSYSKPTAICLMVGLKL
jgi:opacity protein-like surface antigen